MFSRQFTTNHLDTDYVYEVIRLMQRLGWFVDGPTETGLLTVNILLDDMPLWDIVYSYLIDI